MWGGCGGVATVGYGAGKSEDGAALLKRTYV